MKQHVFYILFALTISSGLFASQKSNEEKPFYTAWFSSCCTTASESPTQPETPQEDAALEIAPLSVAIEYSYSTIVKPIAQKIANAVTTQQDAKYSAEAGSNNDSIKTIIKAKSFTLAPGTITSKISFRANESELELARKYIALITSKTIQSNHKNYFVWIRATNINDEQWAERFTQTSMLPVLVDNMFYAKKNKEDYDNFAEKIVSILQDLENSKKSNTITLETSIRYSDSTSAQSSKARKKFSTQAS